MIVLRGKPLDRIVESVRSFQKLCLVGCRGCATVCSAGGEKEVAELRRLLELAAHQEGRELSASEVVLERQCDPEFVEKLPATEAASQIYLSLACGAGVQLLAEKLSPRLVLPGCDTLFIGVAAEKGRWSERCQACGDCKLELTGGICPVSRCSKSLLNGPCGGSSGGHCEIDSQVPCGWQLIVERLEAQGRLAELENMIEPADWSSARDGGPRRLEREDLT